MTESDSTTEFADDFGRTWPLRISVADLPALRRLAKLELTGSAPIFERCAELLGEPEALVRVLYHLCQDQAQRDGVSPEEFARGFGGDVFLPAVKALAGAIIDFFPMARERRAESKQRIAMLDLIPSSSTTAGDSAG